MRSTVTDPATRVNHIGNIPVTVLERETGAPNRQQSAMPSDPQQHFIKEWREARRLTQEQLAGILGTSKTQISRLEHSHRRMTVDWLERIARALRVNRVDLLRAPDLTNPSPGSAKLPPGDAWSNPPVEEVLPQAVPIAWGPRDLPIYGAAECGPNGIVAFDDQHPIDWTWRAPELMGVKDAFAIYASGESMGDAIPEGAIVMVHPHRGPLPGRKCVVMLRGKGALLKIYVGRRGEKVVVRQTNPPQEIAWDAADVQAIYRVIAVVEG